MSYIKGVWLVFIISCFVEISEFNAVSVDIDQTPRSAASDLGLHCLTVALLRGARLKWVNYFCTKKGACGYPFDIASVM